MQTTATLILLIILLLAPVFFGSVLPRERILLDVLAYAALALVVLASRSEESGSAKGDGRRQMLMVAAFTGIALVGLASTLPLPRTIANLLSSPATGHRSEINELLGSADQFFLSLAPEVSWQVALHWLAVVAAGASALVLGQGRWKRRVLFVALLAICGFEVLYSAGGWFGSPGVIWGVAAGDVGRLRGTLINPNHFAMYLLLPTCLCSAYLWWAGRRLLRGRRVEMQVLYAFLPLSLFVLFFVSVALTGSRAGIVAVAGALLAQGCFLALHYRRWLVISVGAVLVTIGVASVGVVGFDKGFGRWLRTSSFEVRNNTRGNVFVGGMELWRSSPLLGYGLGTFREAFPIVQGERTTETWTHAHNDFLEILVTAGVVGETLLVMGCLLLVGLLWKGFHNGRRSEDRTIALAALGACFGIVILSFFEFGLAIPVNAFTAAIVLGLGVGTPRFEMKMV